MSEGEKDTKLRKNEQKKSVIRGKELDVIAQDWKLVGIWWAHIGKSEKKEQEKYKVGDWYRSGKNTVKKTENTHMHTLLLTPYGPV